MSLQQSQTRVVENPDARHESKSDLYGRWLFIARMGWIILTLLILMLSAIAIHQVYVLMQEVCKSGTQCLDTQLTPSDLRTLHLLGLTPGFLTAYNILWAGGTLLFYTVLAALIFWRRSTDRIALFLRKHDGVSR